MEHSHSNEESPCAFFLAGLGALSAAALATYSIISLTMLDLPPYILSSC